MRRFLLRRLVSLKLVGASCGSPPASTRDYRRTERVQTADLSLPISRACGLHRVRPEREAGEHTAVSP